MLKILLKRHIRLGRKFHRRGSVIDVEAERAEHLIARGAAELKDPPAAPADVADVPPEDDVTLASVDPEVPEDSDASPSVDDTPDEDQKAEGDEGPKKPRKVDNLETWQNYHKAMGKDPKGMKLDELKSYWA